VELTADPDVLARIESCLAALHPWRKGPFDISGIHVDAEWRSDYKWSRLRDTVSPLAGRRVLDVGCGNGYFCFRLIGEGARLALGIDPSPLFNVQFAMLKQLFALLHRCLRPGGELLLETLVVDGDENTVLVPHARYARMRNVWFLPSTLAMEHWLRRAGFTQVRCVDESLTTASEQRTTDWMRFESHDQALDPTDPTLTIEGLPAPRRAAFLAERPC